MIHVTPLSRLSETLAATHARQLISLLSVGMDVERPSFLAAEACLHLTMHDIPDERPGFIAPSRDHVAAILDFGDRWNRAAPLVIHCYAGISRSTAAAYMIAAALQPGRSEMELALELRAASPSATPNIRLIALADDMLQRCGRMTAAIRSIGRGAEAYEGAPFMLRVE